MHDILLIDDDSGFRECARLVLEDEGYAVREASCPEEAFAMLLGGETFDLIFCDLHMPFTEGAHQKRFRLSVDVGYRAAKELAWAVPDTRVVVLSSLPPSDMSRLVPHLHPIEAFSKPTNHRDLLNLIEESSLVQ